MGMGFYADDASFTAGLTLCLCDKTGYRHVLYKAAEIARLIRAKFALV